MRPDAKIRFMYNRFKRSYYRLPPELRKILVLYFVVIHVMLFIALVK